MATPQRESKGTYGGARLPVSRRYLYPISRRGLLVLGGLGAALVLAFTVFDFAGRDASSLSNGPLSSSHATLEQDCAACHTPFGAARSESCSVCHEKFGDQLGVFSFAAHTLYRSNDFQRIEAVEHEPPCAACHPEHLGREAEITRVADTQCLTCHDYGSFNRRHPEFDFAAENLPDDDAVAFAHAHHVGEVMTSQALEDVERACLYCHNPRPGGRSFEPLDFDRHCDACHLNASTATTRLPIEGPDTPGVLTLDSLAASREPGTRWALFANPGEFRRAGPRVSKSPLHHEDPWILHNLRRLRRKLYPDAGLADLLTTSADLDPSEARTLYREAVATLEDYALGLRSRPEPEIQAELAAIEQLLTGVRRALEDPYTPLDETEFLLALTSRPRPELAADEGEEIEQVIDDLVAACRVCHRIEGATVARVRTDQRALRRAEFNHRAHILQVRCLECHGEIKILEALAGETKSAESEADRAAIQNLPRIARCQECHNPSTTSNRCITCHAFHPEKDRRSDLLLYLNEPEDR